MNKKIKAIKKQEETQMNSKKLTLALVAGLLCFFGANKVMAADSDTMNVTVTVTGTLDITIANDPYDFGSIAAGITTVSTRAMTVTNSSSDRIADWTIQLTEPANWTFDTHANGPSADRYVLYAQLNSAQPTEASFGANDDMSTSAQNMSASDFSGDENGNNVPTSGARSLWFSMRTPTSTSSQSQQTIVVTITAVDAGTF